MCIRDRYKSGAYTLFKDKEYLAKYDRQGELEEALRAYVRRFEGSDEILVDKGQFCRYSDSGAVQGIIDIAIVRYLMETYCMFCLLYTSPCPMRQSSSSWTMATIRFTEPDR